MVNEQTLRLYWRIDRCYEKESEKLNNGTISEHNRELILGFHKYLFKKHCGEVRVSKLSSQMRRICSLLENKDLDSVTKDNIGDIIVRINTTKEHSDETKKDYRRVVKQFYTFLGKKQFVEDIPIRTKKPQEICRDLITEEEIQKVVASINNPRDKAILMMIHETGARVGEFLGIHLKDIIKGKDIWRIRLFGKTGERIIPILVTIPYLAKYLELHPFKDNPNSYLWIGENNKYQNKPLGYIGINKVIRRSFQNAGIPSKQLNCHNFRHSRATLMAQKLTETQLCQYFGWTLGSTMVKIYVHASGRDLDNAFLSMHGLRKPEEEQSINKPKTCICTQINESTAQFCTRCGKPLDLKIALDSEERTTKATDQLFKLFGQIAQNPELMKQFLEFQKVYEEKNSIEK